MCLEDAPQAPPVTSYACLRRRLSRALSGKADMAFRKSRTCMAWSSTRGFTVRASLDLKMLGTSTAKNIGIIGDNITIAALLKILQSAESSSEEPLAAGADAGCPLSAEKGLVSTLPTLRTLPCGSQTHDIGSQGPSSPPLHSPANQRLIAYTHSTATAGKLPVQCNWRLAARGELLNGCEIPFCVIWHDLQVDR